MTQGSFTKTKGKRTSIKRVAWDGASQTEIAEALLPVKKGGIGNVETFDPKIAPRLVLKQGNKFLVLDKNGMIPSSSKSGYGYYAGDTRHLSRCEFKLNSAPLTCISSTVEDGYSGRFYYESSSIPNHKLLIKREVVLRNHYSERITFFNRTNRTINCKLTLNTEADFQDIFEVYGWSRVERGKQFEPVYNAECGQTIYSYKGRDGQFLETTILFRNRKPLKIVGNEALFDLSILSNESSTIEFVVCTDCDRTNEVNSCGNTLFEKERELSHQTFHEWCRNNVSVETDDISFNSILKTNMRDLYILRHPTPRGMGIAAGVPWFSAMFGRDCAITASQLIAFMPDMAKDCVSLLAAYQGTTINPYTDEKPGRIPHELRVGELARTGEIPHTPYYGTADATQLWLLLFCDYINWSGSLEFARTLWPNVLNAVQWIHETLKSGSGYLRYSKQHLLGLDNQGWKDSWDAITHTNGELANPPIAVCEVQAYVYAAFIELAKIANALGEIEFAQLLNYDAAALKERFQKDFWLESEQYIALALDGNGAQVQAITSNAGHCLKTGILDDDKALIVSRRLMKDDLFSGWGIRTMSTKSIAYSPQSYHNGSVWPHDNAMIADGMFKIGMHKEGHQIMRGIADVAKAQRDLRIPELFCGYDRLSKSIPHHYGVSCSPQAWSAGSIFQMLKGSLGLYPDALNGNLHIINPSLPTWINQIQLSGLTVKDSKIDLLFTRQNGSTSWQALSNSGSIKIIDA